MHPFFSDYLDRLRIQHEALIAAFEGLPPQALDWTPGADMNSLAVLAIHVAGAERYWVGDVALGDPSHRDRPAEFATRGVSPQQMRDALDASYAYVRAALADLTPDDLLTVRRPPDRDRDYTTGWALLHALEHVALHVGHAQLTRQLWDQGIGRSGGGQAGGA